MSLLSPPQIQAEYVADQPKRQALTRTQAGGCDAPNVGKSIVFTVVTYLISCLMVILYRTLGGTWTMPGNLIIGVVYMLIVGWRARSPPMAVTSAAKR